MNSADNTGRVSGTLVPQPHGGAIRTGGNPGNRGGHGRRPDRIKRLAQKALLKRVNLLGHFADGVAVAETVTDQGRKLALVSCTPGERIKALEVLHKIGNGDQVPVSDVRQRLRDQVAQIRQRDTWDTDDLLAMLAAVWS